MPLLKSAKTPNAAPAAAPAPAAIAAPATDAPKATSTGPTLESRLKKLDSKDSQIMVNGCSSAAAGSVGAVQHGGKTPQDYYNRVEEMTRALIDQRLRLLGL